MKNKLEELREQGKKIFSFSKLGSFNNCEYEYYNTYILRNRGIENCYTLIGSEIHNNLESIYKGESDGETLKQNFNNKINELELIGIDFPNENIKKSFMTDMNHFVNNFNKIDSKMLLEQLIVFEIDNDIWMQGYVDAILPSDKGKPYINVYDWKTSSKFTGKKLTDAGRQLLMYKVGLESSTDLKVDKVMWFMIKYINVCWYLKNGNVKRKMCNRGKWVKEIKNQIEKDLSSSGMDAFELEMYLDKVIEENNLNCLPEEIQDKYWVEDCIVEYEITDDKIEELKQYVIETAKAIDSKDINDESDWKPVEITKQNSFYCSVLCGHRKTCKFYKKFLEENADGFEKKEKKFDLDDLFK